MAEFSGRIGHLENIESPWGNAGGVVRALSDVARMALTGVGWIEAGSYTLEKRLGFGASGERAYYHDPETRETYNCFDMPNKGMDIVEKEIPEMVRIAHAHNKKLIVNVAPVSDDPVQETVELVRRAKIAGADAVMLNPDCPNRVNAEGGRHEALSRDTENFRQLLDAIKGGPIIVRLSPQETFAQMMRICGVASRSNVVDAIFVSNAWPGFRPLDEKGEPILEVPGGYGGKSGPGLALQSRRQTAWAVGSLKRSGPRKIDVVRSIAVTTADELQKSLNIGAVAAAGTTFYFESLDWNEDTNRLLSDLAA